MLYAETIEEWSRQVSLRYQGRCAWPSCSNQFGLGSHHVVPRGLEALALVVENGVYLCQTHHDIVEMKKGRPAYEKIMVLLIGQKRWSMLQEERSKAIERITQPQSIGGSIGREASRIDSNL